MSTIGIAKAEQSHIWERQEHEHYVEPEWCSRRLFDVEPFDGPIWDPCCGFGRIPEAARGAGHFVRASDIADRGYEPYPETKVVKDFLESDLGCKNIVCNPPFDIFKDFALHALKLAPCKVAMIWLVRTLPAARWLQDTPLVRVWLLTPRPSMPPGEVITRGEKPGGGQARFLLARLGQGACRAGVDRLAASRRSVQNRSNQMSVLTEPNRELAAMVDRTPRGCAFWSGTGPQGTKCGGCEHHVSVPWGVGTSLRCAKYTQMMNGVEGPKRIPADTPSCKYFEPKKPKAA